MVFDQQLLKRRNRMTLVRLVKAQPGLSRAELAKRSGLTKSTVSVLASELIEEGWLREDDASTVQRLGRRPTPLVLDPSRLALLGAELGVDYLNVVACNLQGKISWSSHVPYHHADVDRSASDLARLIAEAHGFLSVRHCRPLGVGIGVPGPVDGRDGALRFAPNIGWHHVAIGRIFREKLDEVGCADLRVSVLNDANAAALAHYVFGTDPHTSPLVYLTLGIGLGAGIVLGDRLYLGIEGMAGEVGHTILVPDGPECSCGRRGCAEMFISQRAMSRAITGEDAILPIDDLVGRVARKEDAALRAVARAGDFLGLLMQNLCNTLNPAIITLGGPLCQFGEALLEESLKGMRTRGGRYDSDRVTIGLCRFGRNACAVGAAASVFHELLKVDEGPLDRRRAAPVRPGGRLAGRDTAPP